MASEGPGLLSGNVKTPDELSTFNKMTSNEDLCLIPTLFTDHNAAVSVTVAMATANTLSIPPDDEAQRKIFPG